MSCNLSAPSTWTSPVRCVEKDVASCPVGYTSTGLHKTKTSGGYCFGDTVWGKTNRHYRTCEKNPPTVNSMTLEQKLNCCLGKSTSFNDCPRSSDGKAILCPQSSQCDSVILEWCAKEHGGDPVKIKQIQSEIDSLEDSLALDPPKGIDSRLTELNAKKEEIKKYQPKGGPNDPLCGCALPKSYYKGEMFGPIECIDKRCTNPEAYKLSTQVGTTCAVTNCVTGDITLTAEDMANIDNFKLEQDCGVEFIESLRQQAGQTTTTTTTTSSSKNGTGNGTGFDMNILLYIGIALVVILIIVILVYSFRRTKKFGVRPLTRKSFTGIVFSS